MDQSEIDARLQKVLEASKEGARKMEEARKLAVQQAAAALPGIVSEIERLAGCGQNRIEVRYKIPQSVAAMACQEYIVAYERTIREAIFKTPGFSQGPGGTCCGRDLQSFGIKWE